MVCWPTIHPRPYFDLILLCSTCKYYYTSVAAHCPPPPLHLIIYPTFSISRPILLYLSVHILLRYQLFSI